MYLGYAFYFEEYIEIGLTINDSQPLYI